MRIVADMHITDVEIRNFKGLDNLNLTNLKEFVVIAGANGSGKTTILDALRLVKSSYVEGEIDMWLGEFGFGQKDADFTKVVRDANKPCSIRARFELSEEEADFLEPRLENIHSAIQLKRSRVQGMQRPLVVDGSAPLYPLHFNDNQRQSIEKAASEAASQSRAELENRAFTVELTMTARPSRHIKPSALATAALSCHAPKHLGVLDLHTSERSYNRQQQGQIQVRLGQQNDNPQSHLYQPQQKYQNLKTRLTEELVRSKLTDTDESPLQASIQDLFRRFFPNKKFVGIEVDTYTGNLRFDVELSTGEKHDIDDLSSGEKEIIYGYMWLRTSTPEHSVVLIDEPELHLNPALLGGLPDFYLEHLSEALRSQVWIVTHSDAILRVAARSERMGVFHVAAALGDHTNQAQPVDSNDQIENAVLDLIGDLAAYRPHSTIVLVEGSKDTRFDVDVITQLFPEWVGRANFVPAGSRTSAETSSARLREILGETGFSAKAVSICDGDTGSSPADGRYYWPVYEIENFLLDPSVIRHALKTLSRSDPFASDEQVVTALRSVAETQVEYLATVIVQRRINEQLLTAMNTGFGRTSPKADLVAAAEASAQRMKDVDVTEPTLLKLIEAEESRLQKSLTTDEFLSIFPGDRLLSALAGDHHQNAVAFKNTCLEAARLLGLQPQGMRSILEQAIGQ